MTETLGVSLVIPAYNEGEAIGQTLESLIGFLDRSGFSYEIIVVDDGSTDGTSGVVEEFRERSSAVRVLRQAQNQGKGAAVRRGVLDAQGEVIAFIDSDLPYRLENLGHAIAEVHSGATDIAIGARDLELSELDPSYPLQRQIAGRTFSLIVTTFLVPGIRDTQCGLKAFSAAAAKLLFSESKLKGFGIDFEILFLARKYGFRIERLPVGMSHRHASRVRVVRDSILMLRDLVRVRLMNRRMEYRSPGRCHVCFSHEVGSLTQIEGRVIRSCGRCKCRYLAVFPSEDELETLYSSDYFNQKDDLSCGYATDESTLARQKTNEKRAAVLRKFVSWYGRVLDVGAGTGLFGQLLGETFEYVGIDLSGQAVRQARDAGLEVYRANLTSFVNTGPAFDAVTLFHVFEHLPDPHDALAKIHALLKPGGMIVLVTPDTESLLCAISGDRWVSYKLPEHLILYSRSALIELLERSGFEIVSVASDFEYCDHEFLLARVTKLNSLAGAVLRPSLRFLPNPIPVTTGSIRVVAKRRSGPPVNARPVRVAEVTHAR